MNANVEKAIKAVRETIHAQCKTMEPEDYMEFCETIAADMEGNIDALKDENPGRFE